MSWTLKRTGQLAASFNRNSLTATIEQVGQFGATITRVDPTPIAISIVTGDLAEVEALEGQGILILTADSQLQEIEQLVGAALVLIDAVGPLSELEMLQGSGQVVISGDGTLRETETLEGVAEVFSATISGLLREVETIDGAATLVINAAGILPESEQLGGGFIIVTCKAGILAENESIDGAGGIVINVEGSISETEAIEGEGEVYTPGGLSFLDTSASYYAFEDTPGLLVDSDGLVNLASTGITQGSIGKRGECATGFMSSTSNSLRRTSTYTAAQITLSGWFYRTNNRVNHAFFDLDGNNRIFTRNTGEFIFRARDGGSNTEISIAAGTFDTLFPTFSWVHFVFVFDAIGHHVYINGTLRGSATGPGSTVAGTMYIGNLSGGSWQWPGSIDEIGVWTTAASAADVAALYNSGAGSFK